MPYDGVVEPRRLFFTGGSAMATFVLWIVLLGEPIPIMINPGDAVPNIEITSLSNGETVSLPDVFSDGFCFFITPKCAHCEAAMPNIRAWRKDHNLVFVYIGEMTDVLQFIKKHHVETGNAFTADVKNLEPWGLVTYPAALAFKEGRCKVAMHGRLHMKNLGLLEEFYSGTVKVRKKSKKDPQVR